MQMQFQSRKTDLELFKDRAEALQQAVVVLEEGIAASRAQVTQHPSWALLADLHSVTN